VAATPHCDELLVVTGEANRGDHVGHADAAGDQGWAAVDRSVPDLPLLV
jgi:hypothetical protein